MRTEPRIEAEKDADQPNQHSNECGRQMCAEHPAYADAENCRWCQDRKIACGKVMAIKIQAEHVADNIDREQKCGCGDWRYDKCHQWNGKRTDRW